MPITDENQRPALLPCSFCGKPAAYDRNAQLDNIWVRCTSCGESSSVCETPSAAAKKWNARHYPYAHPDLAWLTRKHIDEAKRILAVIAYPRRGTDEERITILELAKDISGIFSSADLMPCAHQDTSEKEAVKANRLSRRITDYLGDYGAPDSELMHPETRNRINIRNILVDCRDFLDSHLGLDAKRGGDQ